MDRSSTGALDPGITVQSCTVDSATQITATINISSTAALGSRNMGITNPNGLSALRILRFEVLPAQ
jgi:hypothetical protein